MESPLAVLSAAAHYVEQMEQLKLTGTVGGSVAPPLSAASVLSSPTSPPVTLLVPCANGLLVPYVQQPGPYYYNLAASTGHHHHRHHHHHHPHHNLHPVPPNKLALSPLSPSSSLSSPHGSLGSAVSSTVSTPTEERHILLPRVSNEELHQKVALHQKTASPTPSTREIATATTEGKQQQQQFNTATLTQKVVLRRKKPQNNDSIHEKVENHFRRSLGSNYKDAPIINPQQPLTQQQPHSSDLIKKVKNNIRRRPHSVFVSEEVDRHFERSLGVEAWQVIQAKRAKMARKTWN